MVAPGIGPVGEDRANDKIKIGAQQCEFDFGQNGPNMLRQIRDTRFR